MRATIACVLLLSWPAWAGNPIADQLVRRGLTPLFDNCLRMERVDVSLLRRTIVIENASLAQPPGFPAGTMLRARSISLKYALFPFFRQRYYIRDITIRQPELILIQDRTGATNLDYYLARLTASREKQRRLAGLMALEQLSATGATIKFSRPDLFPKNQPLFEMTRAEFIVRNLVFPNKGKTCSPFSFSGILSSPTNPVSIRTNGYFVAAPGPLTCTAHSVIQGLPLSDFAFLCPRSPVTITSGTARIASEMICRNNHVESGHRVEIVNLRIVHRNLAKKILLGIPTSVVINFLQNEQGVLQLDVAVGAELNTLKADSPKIVGDAVARAFRTALSEKTRPDTAETNPPF